MSQGRIPVSHKDIRSLAEGVGVPVTELSRKLTDDEKAEWGFYRVSARYPDVVWSRARKAWLAKGLSNREAARIMGIAPARIPPVRRSASRRKQDILAYPAAARLAKALNLADGAHGFVSGLSSPREGSAR